MTVSHSILEALVVQFDDDAHSLVSIVCTDYCLY